MSSYDDITERIIENNRDIKFENIVSNRKKKLLEGKKGNHVSFFVSGEDYIEEGNKGKKRIVCAKCTETFFNIFFKDVKDQNDEMMDEIFKLKVYMNYIPEERLYRCTRDPSHIELTKDPQIQDHPDKKLIGAGIENYPEYVSYLDPDTVTGDFILTVNTGKKKTQRSKQPLFKEKTDDDIWNDFIKSKR